MPRSDSFDRTKKNAPVSVYWYYVNKGHQSRQPWNKAVKRRWILHNLFGLTVQNSVKKTWNQFICTPPFVCRPYDLMHRGIIALCEYIVDQSKYSLLASNFENCYYQFRRSVICKCWNYSDFKFVGHNCLLGRTTRRGLHW